MTCPKCGGEMRRYERNGVDIDQCTECRGIFLDRGELERLVDAESSFYGGERPERRALLWRRRPPRRWAPPAAQGELPERPVRLISGLGTRFDEQPDRRSSSMARLSPIGP